jgi:hypothetical protein
VDEWRLRSHHGNLLGQKFLRNRPAAVVTHRLGWISRAETARGTNRLAFPTHRGLKSFAAALYETQNELRTDGAYLLKTLNLA